MTLCSNGLVIVEARVGQLLARVVLRTFIGHAADMISVWCLILCRIVFVDGDVDEQKTGRHTSPCFLLDLKADKCSTGRSFRKRGHRSPDTYLHFVGLLLDPCCDGLIDPIVDRAVTLCL